MTIKEPRSKEERDSKIRSHIAPMVREIAWRPPKKALQVGFKSYDDPAWVAADDAMHMRDDDYVLGVLVDGQPYCMPQFIIDYYHTVNSEIEGHPTFFSA